jgi:hypothetical protein
MPETALSTTKYDPKLDPFAGIMKGIMAEELNPAMDYKCIGIVGGPKVGKSWLSATMPGFSKVYDFDNRKHSLAGKPRLNISTLQDIDQLKPTVVNDLESDLATLKYRKSKGEAIPDNFIFDSMTNWKRALENEYMRQAGGNSYRILKFASTQLRQWQGYDAINGVKQYIHYFLAEFRQLGNVIVVFHERDEKDKAESTTQITKYTGKYTVDPQYLSDILVVFNDLWRLYIQPGSDKRVLQVEADAEFSACNSLGLKGLQEPDIEKMLKSAKINSLVRT